MFIQKELMPNRHTKYIEREENGFTLVEILIVILIIGVLSAIALPIFLSQHKEATQATIRSDVRNTSVNVASIIVSNPDMDSATLQTAVEENKAILESSDNEITVTGTGRHYFICGKTSDGETEGYSSEYGVIDDCVLGQNPPIDALNSQP